MTEILILLWLADVCKSLSILLGLFGVFGWAIYIIAWVFHYVEEGPRPWKWPAWVLAGMFVLSAALPSERTLHVAAAARAAHLASETELGSLATDAVKQALERLKSGLKEKSK